MIDPGFFTSRQFAIAGVVALLIVGGGAATLAYSGFDGSFRGWKGGCAAPRVEGSPVDPERSMREDREGRDRDVTFTLASEDLAALDLCVLVGEILVSASPDDAVHVIVRVRSDAAEATRETVVETRFTRSPSGLRVAAWESRVGYSSTAFGGQDAAQAIVEVQVPDGARPDLRAVVEVGDARASGILLGNATLGADVGDVRVLDVDLAGDLHATADVGSVVVQLASVQSGTLDVAADVGDVELRLPSRADVGYHVTASSDVGDATVRLGETEDYREKEDAPGESVEARTRGYDGKPTKVRVTATADVGSVLVATEAGA